MRMSYFLNSLFSSLCAAFCPQTVYSLKLDQSCFSEMAPQSRQRLLLPSARCCCASPYFASSPPCLLQLLLWTKRGDLLGQSLGSTCSKLRTNIEEGQNSVFCSIWDVRRLSKPNYKLKWSHTQLWIMVWKEFQLAEGGVTQLNHK